MKKIFFVIIAIMLVQGCKKSVPVSPAPPATFSGCRITKVVVNGPDTTVTTEYDFTYNNDGTVSTIAAKASNVQYTTTTKFSYSSRGILTSTTENGDYYDVADSMTISSDGKVTQTGSKDGWWAFTSYTYDSAGQAILSAYNYAGTITTTNYLWRNGDMVKSGSNTYVYDSTLYNIGNIPAQIDDFLRYGRGIMTSKHLLRQLLVDNAFPINYSYILDGAGKITQILKNDSGYITTTKIYYDCR